MKIIDSHCHVYPKISYFLRENIIHIPKVLWPLIDKIEIFEKKHTNDKEAVLNLAKPILSIIHKQQSKYNNGSDSCLHLKDKIFSLTGFTTLLNSTLNDLNNEMSLHGIEKSLIIAHPPLISNDFILESAKKNKKLIPIVNIEASCNNPEEKLKMYVQRGAKALKIHAAADGLNSRSSHYHKLLECAQTNKLPVIIHTGALEVSPFYKEPKYGHAKIFEAWFKKYDINFVLAHMNIHFPNIAINLCKKFPNVYTDISFQTEETILKAIKKIGSEKIMFGTDWPIIGNNIEVTLKRMNALNESNQISINDFENIMFKTAEGVFEC